MGQVTGRGVAMAFFTEGNYNSASGITATEKLYCASNTLAGTIARLRDPTLSGYRGQPQSIEGDTDLTGDITVMLAPESIGPLLKHAMGTVTTYVPVTEASAIPGVEALRANTGSATGAGTLTWTASGTTLTWAENGDTAGSAVDVSAGGRFSILSNNGQILYVEVTPSLFGADDTSTVTVATGSYEHVFTAGPLPVGLGVEVDYGSDIATAYRWMQYLGQRVSQLRMQKGPSGFIQCTFSLRGASFNNVAGATLDASPDDFGHTAMSMRDASIVEGAATATNITALNIQIDNDLDDSNRVIGGGGARGSLPEGFCNVSGSVEALFDSATLLNKALNGTESSLVLPVVKGSGNGTAGNEYFAIRLPRYLYEASTPPINGPRGVRTSFNLTAHRPSTGELDLELVLRNTRSTV